VPKERLWLREQKAVIVGWERDGGFVQIGVDIDVPFKIQGEVGEELHSSLSVDLNRADVNKLIRTLRRARDLSMGRDA